MNYTVIKKIPSPEEIIQAFPLSEQGHERIAHDRQEIEDILTGQDDRLMCIVGPCSAWPYDAVLEYAKRLKVLDEQVKDRLKLVMRVYIQKPRTAKGWTGPINQVDPYQEPDITEGIKYCRSLMIKIIDMGLPIADDAVFTHNAKGFIELLSWLSIGARSVEDQEHRIFASAVGYPTGMKNSTSGSIQAAVNGIVAAQHPHTAVFNGFQVQTTGNLFAHLILRGGADGPNYGLKHLLQAQALFEDNVIKNPAIIIDASHDNCLVNGQKDHRGQVTVVREVMAMLRERPDLKRLVKGLMLESFIKEGNQKVDELSSETIDRGGLSITDPCLSWEDTELIIKEVFHELKN